MPTIGGDATLKLMTLINVSAAKPNKRKFTFDTTAFMPMKKKRGDALINGHHEDHAGGSGNHNFGHATLARQTQVDEDEVDHFIHAEGSQRAETSLQAEDESDDEKSAKRTQTDAFHSHFASEGKSALAPLAKPLVGEEANKAADLQWNTSQSTLESLGTANVSHIENMKLPKTTPAKPHAKVLDAFKSQGPTLASQASLVNLLGSYQDIVHTSVDLDNHDLYRRAIAMHAVSHIVKTRRRVLKNNDRLGKAAQTGQQVDADVRDQGFTRPKVLILSPLRNTALKWMDYMSRLSACAEIDNAERFKADFMLPEGTIDKLAEPETQAKYPRDHFETFQGNIDDNFKLGAKMTRKSWKIYSQFYESDVILASPLGLRMAIEKDKDADYLSSVEVLIVDQLDVMLMQNWSHLEFAMRHINQIPKSAHDADFSRIKQWYLDGMAKCLRQSVMLSSFDSPEIRKMTRASLINVAGKIYIAEQNQPGVLSDIRSGIRQSFTRIACGNAQMESQLRLEHFLGKTLTALQKSAVNSTAQTLVFVPSYLDFVQLQERLRTEYPEIFATTAMLTEYSEGKEISRARGHFASKKRRFLIVTERFMFYRRYALRGAQTIVFFGLPDHSQYYAEILENLFKPSEKKNTAAAAQKVDPSDLQVFSLYTQFDYLRLGRIMGSTLAQRMINDGEKATWQFA